MNEIDFSKSMARCGRQGKLDSIVCSRKWYFSSRRNFHFI